MKTKTQIVTRYKVQNMTRIRTQSGIQGQGSGMRLGLPTPHFSPLSFLSSQHSWEWLESHVSHGCTIYDDSLGISHPL